jgi:hypothetical protein
LDEADVFEATLSAASERLALQMMPQD